MLLEMKSNKERENDKRTLDNWLESSKQSRLKGGSFKLLFSNKSFWMYFIILVTNVFFDTLIMKKLFLKYIIWAEDAISLSKMLLHSHSAKFTIIFKLNSISLW